MLPEQERLRRWEWVTIALLVLGYAGYYLCRANFSVAKPDIIDELAAGGKMTKEAAKEALGTVASWGTLAYAFGKFISGGLSDTLGGRRTFIAGMVGAVLCTVLFALGGGLPLFTLAWIGNRTLQSLGWPGMVKITSRWFSFSRYGTVMGIISLSYLFGDAASRWFMGELIGRGLTWRSVYYVAASVLGVLVIANLLLLRGSPRDVGASEPQDNPENVYTKDTPSSSTSRPTIEERETEGEGKTGFREILLPLLRSPAFWFVCVMSFGFTIARETFNEWTPTFYTEAVKLTKDDAARYSALFPFFGGVSVLIAGAVSDRLGSTGRAMIIVVGLLISTLLMVALGTVSYTTMLPVVLVSLIGFMMIGPYSFLAGAISLDFGGKRGSATASGIIDGVGYLGGVLAGKQVAALSNAFGWSGAFMALSGIAAASAVVSSIYLVHQRRLAQSAARLAESGR
jgi:OPA family glycerol-3-phosphate transporter-like MFS transporter